MTALACVIGITGWKNSGKTTLAAALIARLSAAGLAVASIKHAHHDFDIDQPGRDSWRHRQAGARQVLVGSARRWALIAEIDPAEPEPGLDAHLARLAPCDVVIVEGFKNSPHPKIECWRGGSTAPRAHGDSSIHAVASDRPLDGLPCPVLDIDDIEAVAGFVARQGGLGPLTPDL